MSQRGLLAIGVVAITASLLIAGAAMATGRVGVPMMGWFASSSGQSIWPEPGANKQ